MRERARETGALIYMLSCTLPLQNAASGEADLTYYKLTAKDVALIAENLQV